MAQAYLRSLDDLKKNFYPDNAVAWRGAAQVTFYGDDVFYGDRFVKFLNQFRAGEVSGGDNSLEGLERMNPGFWKSAWEGTKTLVLLPQIAAGALGQSVGEKGREMG